MESQPVTVWLHPEQSGEDTNVSFSAQLDSVVGSEFICALLRLLADWSGSPLEVALPVDCHQSDWFDLWAEALENAPPRTLEIRFVLASDIPAAGVPQ